MLLSILIISLALFFASTLASTNFAQIYNGQLVTSSALAWQSYSGDQGGDPKQLQFGVHAGKYLSEEDSYTMYVCRAKYEGIYASGHTQKHQQKTVCIVSQNGNEHTAHAFDVLLNKGRAAKLTWKNWNRFLGGTPIGAVSIGDAGHVDDAYIARRYRNSSEPNRQEIDFSVGRFTTNLYLGKIIVNEDHKEKEYEDGQILVESEPIKYELRNIKFSKFRTQVRRNATFLAKTILANDAEYSNLVDTVVSYNYDKIQDWGKSEGVATGLNTSIYETGKIPTDIKWGVRNKVVKVDVKTVNSNLQPGTALNVTVRGNYTKIEAPYTATLVSYYLDQDKPDGLDTATRTIDAILQTADMLDVKFEFSPVYWRHNLTLVPTTTTTTTTTTSTTSTTTPSTTTNREPQPANEPPTDNDTMGNDIAADESHVSAIEDKFKTSSLDAKKSDEYSSNNCNQITSKIVIFVIPVSLIVLIKHFIV